MAYYKINNEIEYKVAKGLLAENKSALKVYESERAIARGREIVIDLLAEIEAYEVRAGIIEDPALVVEYPDFPPEGYTPGRGYFQDLEDDSQNDDGIYQ